MRECPDKKGKQVSKKHNGNAAEEQPTAATVDDAWVMTSIHDTYHGEIILLSITKALSTVWDSKVTIWDSGVSKHMSPYQEDFIKYEEVTDHTVRMGNKS